MESLQTRYKHERAYVNLVTQFDTASVNSVMVANKNAINLRRKIFSIANFPCLRTPFAQNYGILYNFFMTRFFVYILSRKILSALVDRKTANSSRPVFLWRFVWKRATVEQCRSVGLILLYAA